LGIFGARYMVVTATFLLDAALADMDPDSEAAGEVQAANRLLAERFSVPFDASMDFMHRHELELPARIRDAIIRMRETAMRVADVSAMTDPVDVNRRTTAVQNIVVEIRTEIRRLLH